jgi:5-methylcytosine-specific restriction endonuclease McrA
MANNQTLKLKIIANRFKVTCLYCSKHIRNSKDMTLDHVIPKAKGGKDIITNTVISCRDCNSKKGDMLLTQFIKAFDIIITKEIDNFL